MEGEQRSPRQNRALHKYCSLGSEALNDLGMTVEETLSKPLEIPWTPELFKELIWRPVQLAMLKKASTTELTRKEINEVYEPISRHLSEKFGIAIDFPSDEPPMIEEHETHN